MGKKFIQLVFTQGPHANYDAGLDPLTMPGSAEIAHWTKFRGMHYRWMELDQINKDLPDNMVAKELQRPT